LLQYPLPAHSRWFSVSFVTVIFQIVGTDNHNITFASGKRVWLTNGGHICLAGSVVDGERDASSAVIPTIQGTSFCGPSVDEFITINVRVGTEVVREWPCKQWPLLCNVSVSIT
jgi:hypothetical protein